MISKNIIRGSRSSAFIFSSILQNNFSKMSTINNMNLPNVTTHTHTLNSFTIYKCLLNLHPSFQTSSGQSQIAISTLHQHSDVPQSLAAPEQTTRPPNSNHLCICSSRKSNFSPKSTNTLLNSCQFSACWQNGWICACPVCTTRTAPDLCVEDSLLFHLKLSKKRNWSHALTIPGKSWGRIILKTKPRGIKTHPKNRKKLEHNAAVSQRADPLLRASTHRKKWFAKQLSSWAEI